MDTIFRDWAWGEEEVLGAVELVESRLEQATAGQYLLVLGGGAGRLSFELSRRNKWAGVVQLDINPLLTRVAALLSRGQNIVLTEIPNLPRGLDHVVVKHKLQGAEAAPARFVVGDVFGAPFEQESFDVLVTPWLVDILPEDFRILSRRANRLLRDHGVWVNFGPLSFESVPPAARYTQQEIEEALAQAGMKLEESALQCVPYLHSPHGMQKRNEDILVFKAVKQTGAEAPPDFALYPVWMSDPTRPIPKLPAWEEMHAQKIFDIQILSLIDGQASIADIVRKLSSKYSLPQDRCQNVVNRFFAGFFEKEPASR